ncbi:MAG: APC family permease, partial [Longimicrobiales bacterium]
ATAIHPKYRTPHVTTFWTGVAVALGSLVLDENEIYDLTNIGTLTAFAIVCIGVLVLRHVDKDRPRAFRVPAVWAVTLLGAAACTYTMIGLPARSWIRFAVWSALGIAFYFAYSFRHSKLRGAA